VKHQYLGGGDKTGEGGYPGVGSSIGVLDVPWGFVSSADIQAEHHMSIQTARPMPHDLPNHFPYIVNTDQCRPIHSCEAERIGGRDRNSEVQQGEGHPQSTCRRVVQNRSVRKRVLPRTLLTVALIALCTTLGLLEQQQTRSYTTFHPFQQRVDGIDTAPKQPNRWCSGRGSGMEACPI